MRSPRTRCETEAPLAQTITDTHFGARDRMGRLLAFVARMITDGIHESPLGVGVDEETALVVDASGTATVMGTSSVYVISPAQMPTTCSPSKPLVWSMVNLYELAAGDSFHLLDGSTTVLPRTLMASGGMLSPSDPY